ncbi:MAG: type I methionyl aminopeptidase [Lachnospiraceae bacterium]|nr:type I methionyl aminopeptidase [Lachnospiraceae bacterium]
MAVTVKSARQIELMRTAGKYLAELHERMGESLKAGMSTLEIDQLGEKIIRSYGCEPNFLNYNGFPASICVSVNEEVVHGIPKKNRILKEGDVVSLDCGLIYKGWHSDAARTHIIGDAPKEVKDLVERTKQSFFEGIQMAVDGGHLYDISNRIDSYISGFGYGIVRDLVGHGIGQKLHEDPQIPNFAQKKKGIRLCAGMTLAVEPMINLGRGDVDWLDDDWTVVSADRSVSAHYENTIVITKDGEPEILTI